MEFGDEQRLKFTFSDVLIGREVVCNREITFSERYRADTFGVAFFFGFTKENQGFLKEWCGTLDPTIIYINVNPKVVQNNR